FGVGNREPVFAVHGVKLVAPPKRMKDKHAKLKIGMAESEQLLDAAMPAIPRGHPGSASIPRRKRDWRKAITFEALGWHMAERCDQEQLLAGDILDIAFTLEQNDHTDFGGIELALRDFRRSKSAESLKIAGAWAGSTVI